MKVLHLITGLGIGGAEQMLLKTLPRLENENVVVSLTNLDALGKELVGHGIRVHYLGLTKFNLPAAVFRFRRILRAEAPGILNTYLIHADLFGRIFCRGLGVKKVICSVRNKLLKRRFLLFLDRMTSSLVDLYTPNSFAVQKFIVDKLNMPESKTLVIPNSVEVAKFDIKANTGKLKRELSVQEGRVIYFIGSFKKQKGLTYLLYAMPAILGENPDTVLLVVGGGKEERALQQEAKMLGIDTSVRFLGVRKDIAELLQIADVFVLPSLHEGMSNSLLEAMAAGRAIVASDIEENAELIGHEREGLLFKVTDTEDLQKKVNRLLSDPELRTTLGANARQRVEEDYSLDKTLEKLEDLYKDA